MQPIISSTIFSFFFRIHVSMTDIQNVVLTAHIKPGGTLRLTADGFTSLQCIGVARAEAGVDTPVPERIEIRHFDSTQDCDDEADDIRSIFPFVFQPGSQYDWNTIGYVNPNFILSPTRVSGVKLITSTPTNNIYTIKCFFQTMLDPTIKMSPSNIVSILDLPLDS